LFYGYYIDKAGDGSDPPHPDGLPQAARIARVKAEMTKLDALTLFVLFLTLGVAIWKGISRLRALARLSQVREGIADFSVKRIGKHESIQGLKSLKWL
jgi:hypothetical protein